jgi:anti-sigma factor RsiW
MNCKKARARLSAYQDGELAPRQAQGIARHLERCAACQSELAAMNRLLAGLRRLTFPVPPPGLASRIMSGLRTRPQGTHRLLPSLAYALALLAIFIGGFLLEMSVDGQRDVAAQSASTFSAVLAESRNLGLLAVHDSTLEMIGGDAHEK